MNQQNYAVESQRRNLHQAHQTSSPVHEQIELHPGVFGYEKPRDGVS